MKVSVADIRPRISQKINKTEGIISYDSDNAYPQRMIDIIRGSGIATNVVNTFARFVRGKPLEDNFLVNPTLTINKFLRKISLDYARAFGWASHSNYNANLKPSDISHVPFEHCRLTEPDDFGRMANIALYNNWNGRKGRRMIGNIQRIWLYDTDSEVVEKQVEADGGILDYKGQVRWYSVEGQYEYPLSPLDPEIVNIMSDQGISTFNYKDIYTSYMANHIFRHKKFESPEQKQDFIDTINLFQSPEGKKILLVELEEEDEMFNIDKLESVNNDKMYNFASNRIDKKIRTVMSIPAPLAGEFTPGKLGMSQEMIDAFAYYNAFTQIDRSDMEEEVNNLLKEFNGKTIILEPLTFEHGSNVVNIPE